MSITPLPRPAHAEVPTSCRQGKKFCYLVVLNKKFLTLLASDLLLQIEQVLSQIDIRMLVAHYRWYFTQALLSQLDPALVSGFRGQESGN
ncbi:hypothetical protein EAG18_21030 [Pseudoalteromonas sp. J010]|nr:hypothetical protein EAG18_21030 [Pseudoalteromonas sp. J010]